MRRKREREKEKEGRMEFLLSKPIFREYGSMKNQRNSK